MSESTLVAIVGAITSIIGAYFAYKAAIQAKTSVTRVEALEVHVDGRLTQLLGKTEEAATAAGLAAGITQGVEIARVKALEHQAGQASGTQIPPPALPPSPLAESLGTAEKPMQVEVVQTAGEPVPVKVAETPKEEKE